MGKKIVKVLFISMIGMCVVFNGCGKEDLSTEVNESMEIDAGSSENDEKLQGEEVVFDDFGEENFEEDKAINAQEQQITSTETSIDDFWTYESALGYSIKLPSIYKEEVTIVNYDEYDTYMLKDLQDTNDMGELFCVIKVENRWLGETIREYDNVYASELVDGYNVMIGKPKDIQYTDDTKSMYDECLSYYDTIAKEITYDGKKFIKRH